MTPQERLVSTALDQVGYIGKKSSAQLDDFTANSGGKFNKYARDLDALGDFYNYPKQGYDWCDIFVDWCFVQAFGRELAQKLTFQPNRSCGAGTAYSLGYYRNHGRFFSAPQAGDQIFFGDAKSTWHTGIVTRVTGGGGTTARTVCTVEGNAGSPLGVHEFRYPVGSKRIKGYGRPDWSLVTGAALTSPQPVAPPAPSKEIKVGGIVEFTGTQHYTSASGNTSFPCKPGQARVTMIASGSKHPYHLIHTGAGCTVYGWVDGKDLR